MHRAGVFAVHKALAYYAITHVPTGICVWRPFDLNTAKVEANRLDAAFGPIGADAKMGDIDAITAAVEAAGDVPAIEALEAVLYPAVEFR